MRGSALPFPEPDEREAEILLVFGPLVWVSLARLLGERGLERSDRLLEPGLPLLALAQRQQSDAEIVLRRRPVERNRLARPHRQGRLIGGGGLLIMREAILAIALPLQRKTLLVPSRRPA